MNKKNIIPIFVPHLGCPNDCVFCNQRKIACEQETIDRFMVENIIEEYLTYFQDKQNVELAFYGGSFSAIDISIQNELLSVAKKYKELGIIKKVRISTRPDCINQDILKNLKNYEVDTIELGVQSLNDEVLLASNRGHNTQCVYDSSKLIKEFGFKLGLQQMIGLPKDDFKKSFYTAKEFVKLKPDFVRIYPALVIKDTKMEEDFLENKYNPLTLNETVLICKEIFKLYTLNNIPIIRIGLQATNNIQLGEDVVSGPFHPSIRQIIEGEVLFDVLEEYFMNINTENLELTINASNRNISNLSGQKSSIKTKILQKMKLKKLKLIGDKKIGDEILILYYNSKEVKIKIRNYMKLEKKCI
ncbi:MAG: elongator complex protein 3 [Peptoniphilaceae bacterium]